MSPLSLNLPPPPAHVEKYDYEGLHEQHNPFGSQSGRCADARCIRESMGDKGSQPAAPVNISTSPVSPATAHSGFKNPVRQDVFLGTTPPNIPCRFSGRFSISTSSIEGSQAIPRSEIMQGLRGDADSIASGIRFCVENVLLLILDPSSPENTLTPLDEISPKDRKKRMLYRPVSEYREYALGMAGMRRYGDISSVTARVIAHFGAEVEKIISGNDDKVPYTLVMFLLDRISEYESRLKEIESVSAPMRVHIQKRSVELAKVREVTRSSIVGISEIPGELEELEKLLNEKRGREKLAVMEKMKVLRVELAKKLEFLNGNMDEDDLGRAFKNKGKEAAYKKFLKMNELRRIDGLMHRMRGVSKKDEITGNDRVYMGKTGLSRFAHRLIALGIISESEWGNISMDANIVEIFTFLNSALGRKKETLLDELGIKIRSRKRKDEYDPEEQLRKSAHSSGMYRRSLGSTYSEFELEKMELGKQNLRLFDFCIEKEKFTAHGRTVNLADSYANMTDDGRRAYEQEYQSGLVDSRDDDNEDDDDVIPAIIISAPQSDTQSATGTL